jgi:hypothetical protein
VLARLEEIDGVESCFVNEPGTVIRVSLRPDADPGKVAGEVDRVLNEQTAESADGPAGGTALPPGERGAAISQERWRDSRQVASQAAAERRASLRNWLVLLVVCVIILLLGLLYWRRRRRRDDRARPGPAVHLHKA